MDKITPWDEYEIKVRYIPCLITAIFPAHFCVQFLGEAFWKTIATNIGWMLAANISLSLILTLALIQLQCGIAKHYFEESIFGKGGINFPTTNMLLFCTSFLSKNMKKAIREKIKNDFNLILMDAEQERLDLDEAKKRAREAVGLIRKLVGRGIMTYQYNIRYGFIRNLLGGSLWGLAGSVVCAVQYGMEGSWKPASFFILFSACFIFLLLFREKILRSYANQYADTLINEYMNAKGENK